MECKFHVGQKVAATEDLEYGIKKGQVFTVSGVDVGDFESYDGFGQNTALTFYEISPREEYVGFDGRFFRPVVSRKTDISCFTQLLTAVPEKDLV